MKKRSKIILGIVLGIVIVFIVSIGIAISKLPEPVMYDIDNIDFTKLENGTHIGEADNGLVKVKVETTIKDGKVTNIVILNHDKMLGGKAESIVDDVIAKQSLDVDVVTGATYSSSTILKAIEDSLSQ